MLTKEEYFNELGFKLDPFASTNAENEEYLSEYFIYPSYFSSLIGSLNKPKSSIVIAPRGFGKTAQRRKLEDISTEKNDQLLTILYDNFPIEGKSSVNNISLEDHLKRIIRSLLIAFLSKIADEETKLELDKYERITLIEIINKFLNKITPSDITQSINSIKGVKGKLYDIWLTSSKPITSIINAILKSKNFEPINLDFELNQGSFDNNTFADTFNFLEKLFNKIKINSIYILIDKIDENSLTGNDSKSSYQLIQPIIKNLQLLEHNTIVFKFFLWDKITEHWLEDIRLDRIENFKLSWNIEQIRDLINKRLNVLSDNKTTNIHQLIDASEEYINLIFLFSNNSPRDLINILKSIFDDYLNSTHQNYHIPNMKHIINGINRFCQVKYDEIIVSKNRGSIKKVKKCAFTISYLSANIFKENEVKIRNIIMPWNRSGIIFTQPNRVAVSKNKRRVNVYNFTDLRVARMAKFEQDLISFVNESISTCNSCGSINVFEKNNDYDINEIECHSCHSEIRLK